MRVTPSQEIIDRIAGAVSASARNPSLAIESGDIHAVTTAVSAQVVPLVLSATNNEPWYQSRVTWGALGAIVLPLLGFVGITTDVVSLNDFIVGGMTLGSVVSGLLTLYGRWKAKKPIGVA